MSISFRILAAQKATEFASFCELMRDEKVASYLEIGSQYGGSLWAAAQAIPKGSRIVSVDAPQPGLNTDQSLVACVNELNAYGYDASCYLTNSTSASIVKTIAERAPFDMLFIDGDHSLAGVTADWNNYGPMARLVAFHDIAWDRPRQEGKLPCEVSQLWRQIRTNYRHVEFIAPGSYKGIGVLWR